MIKKKEKKKETGEVFIDRGPPALPPSSGPCECLPGKRENRENLLRERRRGGGDATDGERGGVTAEPEKGGGKGKERERERSWFTVFGFHFKCGRFLITQGFSF